MIPLSLRSHYSLMWGTASIKELCSYAKSLGYNTLALTDTNNFYGLWQFLNACNHEGIKPVIGSELIDKQGNKGVCLVENLTGYQNLCRLITKLKTIPQFNLKIELVNYKEGLVVLTNSSDLLSFWHSNGVEVAAMVPGKPAFFNNLRKSAKYLEVPLIATPDIFFLNSQDIIIHKILRAIHNNTSLSCLKSQEVATEDTWLASPSEYERRFEICPEAIYNTYAIAERLTFRGPCFGTVLPPWKNNTESAVTILRDAAYQGAKKRYGFDLPESVVDRLEHELKIITFMGFASYFLIVQDIVSKSPRTCGRGSGAASLVSYCLGITNVCPIKHNLYFERFLNPGRKDPPDIDVDFAWDERDDVINSVLDQFKGYCAMVSSHILFQPRMAIREVAKVYGLTEIEISRVSKRLPWFWRYNGSDGQNESDEEFINQIKNHPAFKTIDFPHPWPEIIEIAKKLIGTPRYLSVHPGGIVITPDPIDSYVPIEYATKGVPILQWEKDGAEQAGLVKIDLLGNRSLGVIRDAIINVFKNGINFDESKWEPEDDPDTQEAVSQGQTMGCFYIESPAMRLLQKKTKVGDFEHLVIHSSIIRPAANSYIQEYIRRLHGGAWQHIHPLLSDVLDETFGIMVFQEDVSLTAVALAGFSHAEADGLRKILSKKDKEYVLADYYDRFSTGAKLKGLSEKQIKGIWEMMMSFDGYSFCKPHSASYARVSFQSAYLKVYYPAQFMAAVLSNQGGFYNTFAYVSEAKRMGIKILPPDINESEIKWMGKDKTIRTGLMAIKGLNAKTQKNIVDSRKKFSFRNISDFLNRIRPDEAEARGLIYCGALDTFLSDGNRANLLWELNKWQRLKSTQTTCFNLFENKLSECRPILPPENEIERFRREFLVLGFLCDRHPMQLYKEMINNTSLIKASNLCCYKGKKVNIAGWLITGKVVHTKHGDPMEFLTFEDETAIFETTFFPKAYSQFCHMIDHNSPYILTGKVEENWGTVTLTVDQVKKIQAFSLSI